MEAALGIMQGRLTPPVQDRLQAFPGDKWENEFFVAEQLGLDCIELIVDGVSRNVNPVLAETPKNGLRQVAAESGVAARSVCADILMERPFAQDSSGALDRVVDLISGCRRVGVARMVIPLVDSIRLREEDLPESAELLASLASSAADAGVELHLETDLDPVAFNEFLERIDSDNVFVNYDTGNSASLGYDPREEFAAYGERIGSVHIKDRLLGGESVPLGKGAADFAAVFEGLSRLGYSGDLILQVARGEPGDEKTWTQANIRWVKMQIQEVMAT